MLHILLIHELILPIWIALLVSRGVKFTLRHCRLYRTQSLIWLHRAFDADLIRLLNWFVENSRIVYHEIETLSLVGLALAVVFLQRVELILLFHELWVPIVNTVEARRRCQFFCFFFPAVVRIWCFRVHVFLLFSLFIMGVAGLDTLKLLVHQMVSEEPVLHIYLLDVELFRQNLLLNLFSLFHICSCQLMLFNVFSILASTHWRFPAGKTRHDIWVEWPLLLNKLLLHLIYLATISVLFHSLLTLIIASVVIHWHTHLFGWLIDDQINRFILSVQIWSIKVASNLRMFL